LTFGDFIEMVLRLRGDKRPSVVEIVDLQKLSHKGQTQVFHHMDVVEDMNAILKDDMQNMICNHPLFQLLSRHPVVQQKTDENHKKPQRNFSRHSDIVEEFRKRHHQLKTRRTDSQLRPLSLPKASDGTIGISSFESLPDSSRSFPSPAGKGEVAFGTVWSERIAIQEGSCGLVDVPEKRPAEVALREQTNQSTAASSGSGAWMSDDGQDFSVPDERSIHGNFPTPIRENVIGVPPKSSIADDRGNAAADPEGPAILRAAPRKCPDASRPVRGDFEQDLDDLDYFVEPIANVAALRDQFTELRVVETVVNRSDDQAANDRPYVCMDLSFMTTTVKPWQRASP
jgi:hypothetical protein